MDSGNSGSLHSSSGADQDCDSRAPVDSHAAFITTHHPQPHPPPPLPFNHHHHHMFDQNQINNPLLFTQHQHQHQHQLVNLDSLVWSKTLPSFSDHHFFPSSSQPTAHTVPFSPPTTTTAEPITSTTAPRNPKKRSRASRRAPTTVLTTDTSNFRAMVQEFTGIPAPPFTSPAPSPSSFDLLGMMRMRSNTNNFDNLPQLPPYLLQSSSSGTNLLSTTMQKQNTISFPCNSLNPKTTQQNNLVSSNQIYQQNNLVSSRGTATPTEGRIAGNLDGKESSCVMITDHHHSISPGMKPDQGFIEPWICSSD